MIVKVEYDDILEEYFIPIPGFVMEQLNLKMGDDVVIDFPTAYPDQIIVHKKETK